MSTQEDTEIESERESNIRTAKSFADRLERRAHALIIEAKALRDMAGRLEKAAEADEVKNGYRKNYF